MPQMIIANRLTDGLVVFYTQAGGWTMDISEGLVIEGDADAQRLFQSAKLDEENCLIIDPNLIEVAEQDGRMQPTSIREAIRAFGPTV